MENIKTRRAIFLALCHHGVCSGIIDHPLPNIKLDQHIVTTGLFFVGQVADDVRNAYAEKTADKIAAKDNC